MQNAALLRRRVRDSRLRLERVQLKERSGTDVVLCYMEGEADPSLLDELRRKLAAVDVGSIAMSQESLTEALSPRQFWNPLGYGKLSTQEYPPPKQAGDTLSSHLSHHVIIHSRIGYFQRIHQLVHYGPRLFRRAG